MLNFSFFFISPLSHNSFFLESELSRGLALMMSRRLTTPLAGGRGKQPGINFAGCVGYDDEIDDDKIDDADDDDEDEEDYEIDDDDRR